MPFEDNMKLSETTPFIPTGEESPAPPSAPVVRKWLSPEKRGYVWILSSALLTTAAAVVLAREVMQNHRLLFPELLFVRGVVTLCYVALALATLLLPPLRRQREGRDWQPKFVLTRAVVALLAARAIATFMSILLYGAALELLSLEEAAPFIATYPVFGLLFGWLLVGEKVTSWDARSALLNISGGALITMPWHKFGSVAPPSVIAGESHDWDRVTGVLLMLGAAAMARLSQSLVRRLGDRVHCLTSVGAQGVGILLAALLLEGDYNLDSAMDRNARVLPTLVVWATLVFAGQTAANRGLQLSRVGASMLIFNSNVPLTYAVLFGSLGEMPSLVQILGIILVISSGAVLALQKV